MTVVKGAGSILLVLAFVLGGCSATAVVCSDASALSAARQHVNATVRRPVESLKVVSAEGGEPRRVTISGYFMQEESPSMFFEATGSTREGDCTWEFRPTSAPGVEHS